MTEYQLAPSMRTHSSSDLNQPNNVSFIHIIYWLGKNVQLGLKNVCGYF